MSTPKLTKVQRYTAEQVDLLNRANHERSCKWFDDQDWNGATFANYVHNTGDYPECTCEALAALKDGAK